MSKRKNLQAIRKKAPTSIEFGAELTIEAGEGEGKIPSFDVKAYNGGKLPVKGFPYPVVVELLSASFEKPDTKANRNHKQDRELGHTETQEIDASGIRFAGLFSVPSKDRDEIIEAHKAGFTWNASIEASFPKAQFIERGKSLNVNGQTQSGPFYFARNAVITGFAILNRGADRDTVVNISAEEKDIETMDPKLSQYITAQGFDPAEIEGNANKVAFFQAQMSQEPKPAEVDTSVLTLQAEAAAEQAETQQEIRSICAQFGNPTIEIDGKEVSLEAHAYRKNLTPREVSLEARIYDLKNKSAGSGPVPSFSSTGDTDLDQETLCASLAMNHFGISEESAAKSYSDKAMNEASRTENRQHSLHSIMGKICAAAGMPYHGAYKSMDFWAHTHEASQKLQASGTSTLSLPNLFENVLNKAQLDSFQMVPQMWRQIAHVGSVNDFKATSRIRLTGDGGYRRIGKDGEIKHVGITESKRTNQADTFGAMMSLTRKDIINDDLSALTRVASMLGTMAGTRLEEEVWITLMGNAGTFFGPGNKNVGTGALDMDKLTEARNLFINRVDKNNKPIVVGPALLVTGIPQADIAEKLYGQGQWHVGNQDTAATAVSLVPTNNQHVGKYTPVICPYLSNQDIRSSEGKAIPNQADNLWFLMSMATASVHAIEVLFLNGMQSPTTSTSDMEFNKLGIQYRSYHDFGVGYGDPEAAVKMN